MGYYWKNFLANVKSIMEYRFSFITQCIGMMINDGFWLFFWWAIYAKFDTIKGYTFQDNMLLFALGAASFGMTGTIFGNWRSIAEFISRGELDRYLTIPKNVLMNLLTGRVYFDGVGDFLFGILIILVFLPASKWLLFMFFVITAGILLTDLMVIVGSFGFWFGRTEDFSDQFVFGFINFTMYPFSIFDGVIKFLFFTALPVGFIVGIPVELLKNFNWTSMLFLIGYTVMFTALAYWFFYKGLKKYEGGSAMTIRL